MVSPQPESQSAKLAQQINAPMQFVVDNSSTLAKAIGINASGGLPTGLQLLGYDSDVPMPTVLLTDGNKIVWSAQTDNYRVRPEPEVFLAAIEAYQAQK
jgi:peroxiredoxin